MAGSRFKYGLLLALPVAFGITVAPPRVEPVAVVPQAAQHPASAPAPSVPPPPPEPTNATFTGAAASATALGPDSARTARATLADPIGSAALAAYQRAAAVINAADKACNIDWQLIAAIGRVESDHGRYGGNVLDDEGVARPGIYGIALDGTNNTRAISDTDAGQYDNDTVWDRAVGPMQFIPSTWSVVGVDADKDGVRNPQDIDDAALAAAVYLCSGEDDLSTDKGQRTAVYRYNNSNAYVDLVLDIMKAYQQGEFTSVPNSTTSASMFSPDTSSPNFVNGPDGMVVMASPPQPKTVQSTSPTQSTAPTQSTTPTQPTAPGAQEPTGPGGDKPAAPSVPKEPGKVVEDVVKNTAKALEDTVKGVTKPVEDLVKTPVAQLLSAADALTLCKLELSSISNLLGLRDVAVDRCAARAEGKTRDQALGLIPGLLKALGLQN